MKKTNLFFNRIMSGKVLFAIALSMAVVVTSCKKEEDDDPAPTTNNNNNTNQPTTPSAPADVNGTLVAANMVTSYSVPGFGTQEFPYTTGIAIFYDDVAAANAQNFLDAGTVSVESEELTKQPDNVYFYNAGQFDPTKGFGITISGDVDWQVSGKGNIPTISESIGIGFPFVGTFTADSIIDKSKSYTMNTNISNADSVIWLLVGGDVQLFKTTGMQNSYTFPASEVAKLKAGQGVAQVVAYRYTTKSTGTKKFFYVNEEIKSKIVDVQ